MFCHLLKAFPPFFVVCNLINNTSVILEMLTINHKNETWQLVGSDSRDLLKKLRKLHCYRLRVSISQALAIGNVAYYKPF